MMYAYYTMKGQNYRTTFKDENELCQWFYNNPDAILIMVERFDPEEYDIDVAY